jgi:transcriptional regulator with XRE-family HTH domain
LIRRGWTQERIAAAVGCRQSAVSRWVKGIRTPGGVNMLRLKEVFDGVSDGTR